MRLELRKPPGPVEDSIAMRVVVAALVEIAIAAVVAQPGAVPAPVAIATLLLAPFGYWTRTSTSWAAGLVAPGKAPGAILL